MMPISHQLPSSRDIILYVYYTYTHTYTSIPSSARVREPRLRRRIVIALISVDRPVPSYFHLRIGFNI